MKCAFAKTDVIFYVCLYIVCRNWSICNLEVQILIRSKVSCITLRQGMNSVKQFQMVVARETFFFQRVMHTFSFKKIICSMPHSIFVAIWEIKSCSVILMAFINEMLKYLVIHLLIILHLDLRSCYFSPNYILFMSGLVGNFSNETS